MQNMTVASCGSKATEKLNKMGLFRRRREAPEILGETDFNRRTNELKRKSNTKLKATPTRARALPKREVRVRGTVYCKPRLSPSSRARLTVTKKNQYQIEHGWPEGNILNVNTLGSKETTANNFIGYVNANDAIDLYESVQRSGRRDVFAKIELSSNAPIVTLLLDA